MFDYKNWTYRQKNRYLLIGAGLFLVISWLLTFSKTLDEWQTNQTLKAQSIEGQQAAVEVNNLRSRWEQMNLLVSGFEVDSAHNHEVALEVVSSFCDKTKGLKIIDFPTPTIQKKQDFQIVNNVIEVEGSFTKLLQLVYHLEMENRIGRLAQVKFDLRRNKSTKRDFLVVKIILQNIKFV